MFTRTLNRVEPKLPVTAMRTHAIFAPVDTHFRPATCAEIGCLAFHNGWSFDTAGQNADVIALAKQSGRRHRVERDETTGTEVLHFEAGQPCFKASGHRMRVDRPELFIVRSGDHRGNPDGANSVTQFSGPEAWADSVHTQLEKCTNG
jgi:hypothetical protein